jgi:uncharacterized protein (TIGR00297 family)
MNDEPKQILFIVHPSSFIITAMASEPSTHSTHEPLRKVLHIGFGLFAFSLRWLSWPVAAAVAACAVLGNWLLLHRIVGARVARHERGYDAGIVLYPAMVLALIVTFRHRIEIAGTVWAILAFGDGFATLSGKAIGGPRLPWSREKSWSGLAAFAAFGFVAAEVVYLWLRTAPTSLPTVVIIAGTVLVCAFVESLPLNVDDNVTIPIAGAATMAALVYASLIAFPTVDTTVIAWLVVNTILAILGYLARSVDVSGLIGGWLLGAVVIVFGGWPLYAVLLTFFVIGTATTKLGYRRKERAGLAQEKEGRRGFSHAFSNVGVAALLAIASAAIPLERTALWLAAAAALATAAADTTASEIGQLLGRRAFLPMTLRSAPVGTEGAISVEGTLAGLIAGLLVATVAALTEFRTPSIRIVGALTAAAFAGSYIESLAGNWNRPRENPVPNGVLNFFNTAVGACLLLIIIQLI